MKTVLWILAAVWAISAIPGLQAGDRPGLGAGNRSLFLGPSLTSAIGGGLSPTRFVEIKRIEHRARVLGDSVAGNGERYFAVNDRDLRNAKTSAERIAVLTPPSVKQGDRVRKVNVVIDVRNPLFLRVPDAQLVRLGAVEVDPAIRRLEVNTIVNLAQLKVTTAPVK